MLYENICTVFDNTPTVQSVFAALGALVTNGFTSDEAGTAVAVAVVDHCPRHMGLIESFIALVENAKSGTLA